MWRLLFFALISSVVCHDVYRFSRQFIKPIPELKKTPVNVVYCPDGQSQCDDGSTCCASAEGGYDCCPYSSAVCCSDKLHCCPQNTVCNMNKGTCDSVVSKPFSKMTTKIPAISSGSVTCPDHASTCDNGSTCCLLLDGNYGCCPLVNAVCCTDKIHCCPENTECNLSKETCDSITIKEVSLLKFMPNPVKRVICPSVKYQCSDGETCCELPTANTYGCCPYPGATCCSDKLHCCPNATVCNLESGTCDKNKELIVSLKKSKLSTVKVDSVICPDGTSQCDDGNTCCLLKSGDFGCCQGINSVCCSDKLHCCPQGTRCNLVNGTCDSLIGLLKNKISSISIKSVTCPDGSSCYTGNTCCPLVDSSYGCCPYSNGVCCSDHSHCCPSSTSCNPNSKTCDKNPFFKFPGFNLQP